MCGVAKMQGCVDQKHQFGKAPLMHERKVGKLFFRDRRMPFNSGVQVVIQLASLLYFGVQYPSWETLTMMLFRSGRLDWIQSVSPAMFNFCEAAFNLISAKLSGPRCFEK